MFTVKTNEGEYKVKFHHEYFRFVVKFRGCTVCKIYKNGKVYSTGTAYCSRLEPNFVKSIGRKIALARALDPYDLLSDFDKETRTLFWKEYFKARNGRKD